MQVKFKRYRDHKGSVRFEEVPQAVNGVEPPKVLRTLYVQREAMTTENDFVGGQGCQIVEVEIRGL